ncbi:MAG: hypothetical protein ACREO1_06770 [Arenimonas sp.]
MINRFQTATPTAMALPGNSQVKQARVGDDFSLLLNQIVNPINESPNFNAPEVAIPVTTVTDSSMSHDEAFAPASSDAVIFPAYHAEQVLATKAPQLHVANDSQNFIGALGYQVANRSAIPALDVLPTSNSETLVEMAVGNEHVQISAEEEVRISPVPTLEVASRSQIPLTNVLQPSSSGTSVQNDSAQPVTAEADLGISPVQALEDVPPGSSGEDVFLEAPQENTVGAHAKKHSSSATGEVEFVAIPWRLQANASLSYQSTVQRTELTNGNGLQSADSAPVAATHVRGQSQLQKPFNPVLMDSDRDSDPLQSFSPLSKAIFESANASEAARTLRSEARGSIVMWPQRVLRWLSDGDATTAWVRDYQIDANETKTLVEALRCHAEQQGFSLRRIMLNGHEAWRAPSTF